MIFDNKVISFLKNCNFPECSQADNSVATLLQILQVHKCTNCRVKKINKTELPLHLKKFFFFFLFLNGFS